jgi:5,6,7,8-tetrahydromethanopterin hydro-lyase
VEERGYVMSSFEKQFDSLIGEAYAGDSPNGSHINVVISEKGSATYAAGVKTLLSPSPGHVPFLACLGLGNLVRPATIVINKITLDNERYEKIFYGGAQLGIGQGVLDAVRNGLLPKERLDDISILVACWIDPNAIDETKVRVHTRDAMCRAIQDAVSPTSEDYINKLLSTYESATNNYYSGQ